MEKEFKNYAPGHIETPTEDNDTEFFYLGPHLRSIESIGVTRDYFNGVPSNPEDEKVLDSFISLCKQGRKKNYTERYQGSPTVLGKSDPEKVREIDRLMDEAREAAKLDNRETVIARIKELQLFNPPPK